MKTIVVPLIGDPIENLYQLGQRERDAFLRLEKRVTHLLSTNLLLRFGQDVITRAKTFLKRKEESYFDKVVDAANGSYYIEQLTDKIAEAAWNRYETL